MNNYISYEYIRKSAYSWLMSLETAGVAIDGDDPNHIKWILEKSQERASQYNISGVNYRLTQGLHFVL